MKTTWSSALMLLWWGCLLAGLGAAVFLNTRIREERVNLSTQVARISALKAFDQAVVDRHTHVDSEDNSPGEADGTVAAARLRLDAADRDAPQAQALVAALQSASTASVQEASRSWTNQRIARARSSLAGISTRLESLWSAMFFSLVAALALAIGAAVVALVRRLRLGSTQRRVAQLDHVLTSLLGGAPLGLFAMDEDGRFQVLAGSITADWRDAGSTDAPAWERLAEHVSLAQALKAGHEHGALSTSASVGDQRLDLSFSRVSSEHATDLRTLGVVVDLGARVAPRDDVRFAEDEERFESLGSIAGGIAHEFNNLLVGILGYTHLAGLEDGTPPAVHRHLSRIEDSGKRAGHVVKKLMASAGHARTEVESVRLADLVHEALNTIELPESVQLDEHVMRRQAIAFADPGQIRLIVQQLVENGIEAIGTVVGNIAVRTGQCTYSRSELTAARAGCPTLVAGPYAYIEVSDSGSGMDEDTENHMFDPYFSTRFPGRGLGLSTVYGIVRRHHGAIFVNTAPEKGTIIRVALPSEPPPPIKPSPLPKKHPGKAGTVLVIEQDRPIQAYINAVLKRRGFEVIRATDGVEGLAIYAQRVGTIDIVIVDAALTDPDTETVLHDLRGRKRDQAIILTGPKRFGPPTYEPGGPRVGWLSKPFKVEALLRAVRALLPVTNGKK